MELMDNRSEKPLGGAKKTLSLNDYLIMEGKKGADLNKSILFLSDTFP